MNRMLTCITSAALGQHRSAIVSAARARVEAWGASGFSFKGRSPDIRVEMDFPRGRALPSAAEMWIPLPPALGGRLKVYSSRRSSRNKSNVPRPFADVGYDPVAAPLAPGSRILVRRESSVGIGGVAAVVSLDGRLHILTCGHLFDGMTEVLDGSGGEVIATLVRSYFSDIEPLDAAVCELNDAGRALLDRSTDAQTWFSVCRPPEPADNEGEAVFFPTSVGNAGPYCVLIASYWASTSVLFQTGRRDGLIELSGAVVAGDSGSVLAISEAYYGICSGEVEGRWSYFTPIASALVRLSQDYNEVALWKP